MNNFGPLSGTQMSNTLSNIMGIINPDEHLQQNVVTQLMSDLSLSFPSVLVVYNRHHYHVFVNLSWFKYLLFLLFSVRSLKRDIESEVREVDGKLRGISFYNKISHQAISMIK